MIITVNGQKTTVSKGMSLYDFLKLKGLDPQKVVVEHNYRIVKTEEWPNIVLQENDNLEILRFVGGG
ncbi:sulfur carrier protein [Caldicoprobacter guelmensis]|uniref:sulfur carrier protein ThiS n=1 Tax=Caldicoprobacter guelmensis TaxID=1170224 RepID=UPI00195DC6B2|nr:sulfur carrier protein ThiS [Caldicoprobacter guelmensis]MBM7582249.1 sulfur carrier protein [Caldicoprobacter guelmensis]